MRKSPQEQLVHHVQNLERLEAAKEAAADEFRGGLAGARAAGYDTSTLRVVLRLRKLTPGQRKERRALEAIYLAALGMLEGDALPEEARRRLDEEPRREQPAKGLTEAGSKPTRESKTPPPPPPPPQMPMNLKDPEEARQEGRAAAGAGKRIYDNPYPAGDLCRASWDEGWCEGKKSNGMETPAAYQRRSKPPEKSEKDEKGAA